jgi:hypothetical protein
MATYGVQVAAYGSPTGHLRQFMRSVESPKKKAANSRIRSKSSETSALGGANAPNPDLSMPRKTTTYAVTHNAQSLTFGIAAIQAAVAAVQHDHGGGPALGTYLVQLVQFGLYKSLGQKRRQLQPLAAKHQKRVRGGLWRVLSTQLSWR